MQISCVQRLIPEILLQSRTSFARLNVFPPVQLKRISHEKNSDRFGNPVLRFRASYGSIRTSSCTSCSCSCSSSSRHHRCRPEHERPDRNRRSRCRCRRCSQLGFDHHASRNRYPSLISWLRRQRYVGSILTCSSSQGQVCRFER